MTAIAVRPSLALRGLGALRTLFLGTLLCLTPLTSLVALGWLTRHMAAVAKGSGERTGWVLGPRGQGWIVRVLGGLGANIREGVRTALALFLYTAPFAVVWLGAWWAGWQNSFHKGYEDAFVAPLVFVIALALGLVLIAHLPFALSHFAATGRFAAMFEARAIRAAFCRAGWKTPALMVLTLVLALPVSFGRVWPTLSAEFGVDLDQMTPEEVTSIAEDLRFLMAVWIFCSLLLLRHLAARAYARVATPPNLVMRLIWTGLALAPAFGLFLLILAAQFMNYAWWQWITHPFLTLPWAG